MVWKILERSSVQLISLVVQLVLARLIEPERFGSLSIILVFYNLADLLVQKGFGIALIRKETISKHDIDSVFLLSSLLAIFGFTVIFVTAPCICIYYNDMTLLWPLRVMGGGLFLSPLYCVCNALLVREMQFKLIFVRGLIATTISGGVGIVMALRGADLWALVGQMIMNQFLLTVFMCCSTKYIGGFSFSKESVRQILGFGSKVLLTELLLTLLESIRSLLIGKVYSPEDLAYYDRGQMYPATLMRAIYDTLFTTLVPYFAKIQNNYVEQKQKYKLLLYYVCCVVFPVFLGLAAVSDNVILLLLGDKWIRAVPYMQVFCIYQAVFPYQIISKAFLYAQGDSSQVLRLEMIKSGISFLLMLLSFSFGPIYVAVSLILVRIVSDALYVHAVKHELGKMSVLRITWKPMVSSLMMVIVVCLAGNLEMSNIVLLPARVLLGVLVYCAMMFVLDRNIFGSIKNVVGGYNK